MRTNSKDMLSGGDLILTAGQSDGIFENKGFRHYSIYFYPLGIVVLDHSKCKDKCKELYSGMRIGHANADG